MFLYEDILFLFTARIPVSLSDGSGAFDRIERIC